MEENNPKIYIDTESPPMFPKDQKILVVGRDDVSMEAILDAVKSAGEGQVVVVDSISEPKFDEVKGLKESEVREADNFIRQVKSVLGWGHWWERWVIL